MDKTESNDGLRYLGGGSLIGVPARDLTPDEVKEFGKARLLSSGLYATFKKVYVPKPSTKTALKGDETDTPKE